MSSSLKREPYGRCLILKPDPDEDRYEARMLRGKVQWAGTRAEAEAAGIDTERLNRAASTGTSNRWGYFGWDD